MNDEDKERTEKREKDAFFGGIVLGFLALFVVSLVYKSVSSHMEWEAEREKRELTELIETVIEEHVERDLERINNLMNHNRRLIERVDQNLRIVNTNTENGLDSFHKLQKEVLKRCESVQSE